MKLSKANYMRGLQELVTKANQNVDCKLEHTFSEGLYTRQLSIPKGSLVVGKLHRHKTLNILIKGSVTLYTGDKPVRLNAPYIFESDVMTRKAIYTHSDTVWANIHVTNITDLDEIEREFIVDESITIEAKEVNECLGC